MTAVLNLYTTLMGTVLRLLGDWFLPSFARFSFAAVLLFYFWNSALTKIGSGIFGIFSPTENAYIQIFPKKFEAAGYDITQMGGFDWLVAVAGTCAEFILPLLIVIGLFTRLAALGMAGFVIVQSYVDVVGHGVSGKTLGAWFDGPSDALILDQRLMWMLLFAVLFIKGAGPISIDRILRQPVKI
ncbi:DoxX family protein [Roseobacter sp. N2S]|uniref:DoxX family protein n=1 Tax=Roseobacter sp. N2S TaxID=2663844 RepID=UPI0028644192|nr:DoxX family protein [Roseobacter sp. N2S]MDR6265108.1 putative oxidoreductase [Roseobacter sp. N2S]